MNLNLNLNLDKPIVFLKVATTGMKPLDEKGVQGDRIIEISITKIDTDRTVKNGTKLVNPERPIPAEATLINGITDEMVSGHPTFREIAANLYAFIGDSDIAGFSITTFDLRFLIEEFNRVGIPFTIVNRRIIDISNIYHQMEKRDFRTAAIKFAGHSLTEEPISCQTINNISIGILNGMVNEFGGDSRFVNPNPKTLHEHFNTNKALDVHKHILLNSEGRPVFGVGKYKGKIIADILLSDSPYCDWCINVSDFPADTKLLLKGIIDRAKANQSSIPQQNS